MYSVCEGFQQLSDIAHKQKSRKIVMLFKQSVNVLRDLLQTFNAAKETRRCVQEVVQSKVGACKI